MITNRQERAALRVIGPLVTALGIAIFFLTMIVSYLISAVPTKGTNTDPIYYARFYVGLFNIMGVITSISVALFGTFLSRFLSGIRWIMEELEK